jgi:hypothetical protein
VFLVETSTVDDVAAICSELLYGQPIPVAENLHDMGLNSALVIRLRRRIFMRFGVKLPLTVFYEGRPTAASISEEVDAHVSAGAESK